VQYDEFGNDRRAPRMESRKSDLRRSDTLGLVKLETQCHSGFPLGTVGVGALALALPELGGKASVLLPPVAP
jgi:hypothetical protein